MLFVCLQHGKGQPAPQIVDWNYCLETFNLFAKMLGDIIAREPENPRWLFEVIPNSVIETLEPDGLYLVPTSLHAFDISQTLRTAGRQRLTNAVIIKMQIESLLLSLPKHDMLSGMFIDYASRPSN